MADEGLIMKSGPKPEKSVTFSGQDEIIWGSPRSSSSSMSSSVLFPEGSQGVSNLMRESGGARCLHSTRPS